MSKRVAAILVFCLLFDRKTGFDKQESKRPKHAVLPYIQHIAQHGVPTVITTVLDGNQFLFPWQPA